MGPLHGLKVLEMAGLGPTPFCGMLLGDMGADVVRVDRTEPADLGIDFPSTFDLRNRNKRSIAIDLKKPEGVALLMRLVAQADVFTEGFRPGTAERLGIGPDVCLRCNPKLVYGRATGWGQDGPLAKTAGHDINYIALTGALNSIGPAGGQPTPPLNLLGDYGGGALYMAFGILCAVLEARSSGRGQIVDAAMVDGVTSLMTVCHALRQTGRLLLERGSNDLDGGAPYYSTYETKDGRYVAVGAIEARFYAELLRGLAIDPRTMPPQHDRSRWSEAKARLANVFRTRSRDEWIAHFREVDACVSPVLDLDEAAHHPHTEARQSLVVRDGVLQPRPVPRLSRTPGELARRAPRRGEHTVEVLEALGLSKDEIREGIQAAVLMVAE